MTRTRARTGYRLLCVIAVAVSAVAFAVSIYRT